MPGSITPFTSTPASTPATPAPAASVPATSPPSVPSPSSNTVEDNPQRIGDDGNQHTHNTTATTSNTVDDISGPCEEAEHANDSRCTEAPSASSDDDRGRGHGSDDRGQHHAGHGSHD
jgi:hypothetical protein